MITKKKHKKTNVSTINKKNKKKSNIKKKYKVVVVGLSRKRQSTAQSAAGCEKLLKRR